MSNTLPLLSILLLLIIKQFIMQTKIFGGLIVFLIGMILFSSCSKDTVVRPQVIINPNLKISFKDTIQPIFTSNCASSSCHSGTVAPNLSLGQAYSSLISGNYVNTAAPTSSVIFTVMTPGGIMADHCTVDQANLVLAWIKQGALNN
jgi:hypothetical protein